MNSDCALRTNIYSPQIGLRGRGMYVPERYIYDQVDRKA
jgi:hypothetical protein